MRKTSLFTAAAFLLIALSVSALAGGAHRWVYLLEAPKDVPFNAWRAELESRGIHMAHVFPPAGGIVVSDEDAPSWTALVEEGLGTRVFADSPYGDDEERIRATREGDILWSAQRKLLAVEGECLTGEGLRGSPLVDDAFAPPAAAVEELLGSCSATSLKYSGTEYLLGNVSVNVILPESDGTIDTQTENWDSTRETNVTNQITSGLDSLRNLYTLTASLKPSFTYHYYFGRTNANARTSYEPITRNASPTYNDCTVGEGLWACEILNKLGYSAYSNYTKALEFNGNTRTSDGTDWAFTIWVVDSLNDADGRFPDNRFGYAWIGGPWVVMTYDNNGWGISNMYQVTRHETGHINYAWDEYSSSPCTCVQVGGYVNYANQNCQKTCSIDVTCVMDNNAAAACYYTRGQVGWGDLDSDTIPDPVDIEPQTALTAYAPDPTTNTTLTYNGTATIQKNTNNNVYGYNCDINILAIANVQYRVDGGAWQNATASDGSFNSASENYTMTIGPLANGVHTIDTRAVDEVGQTDSSVSTDTVTVNAPVSTPPGVQNGTTGTAMTAARNTQDGSQIAVTWDNSCAAPRYSLVCGPGSGLPSSYSGIYGVSSAQSVCNMGAGPNYTWNNTADPTTDARRFYWWIVVATDAGSTTEGAWGKNSGNTERTGPGTNGSSGLCAITTKNTTNVCGQ